ncbi:MAG: efflux RND transporter permease subunit [Planctomycetota bacterium]
MLARFFVDRPIFAWVISIVITLVGAVAVYTLPISQYPDITPPTVQVVATYPGANAKVVADSIAAPIEQQVNGVEGMLYMSSQCGNDGSYILTITFDLGVDLNKSQVLVQNRVALATPQLPPEVQVQGVTTKKMSPSILLVVNLISPDGRYDDLFVSNYALINVRDELARVAGVGDAQLFGQRDYSMRVWLDPDKMAARNLTTSDVVTAVRSQNVQVAAGQIGRPPIPDGQQFQFTMSTLGRLEETEQFGNIIIKTTHGEPGDAVTSSQIVRLKDVGRIELGALQYDQISKMDGLPSVGLAIFQLPGSNALATAHEVKRRMEELKRQFPVGIDYKIVYDTTPFIEQSIHEVFITLRDAIILVAIVVLLFLQDWKAMILPMIDVPVSLVGTFAVMAMATMVGTTLEVPSLVFSLNNLTLFGLVLAIGIVVDDAIVVLENIERLIGTGLDPRTATIKAMEEITGPIVAITLVLCSVFLPAAFITGITGQFFRQFALTIAAAMVISAINAMTLTPARAVTIFKTEHTADGQHIHIREALPWWFFACLGSYFSYNWMYGSWAEPITQMFIPGHDAHGHGNTPEWLGWLIMCILMVPGLAVGGGLGWFIIRPVNYILGLFFRGFNKAFDLVAAVYGWTVGRMLRVTVMVLFVYGGLLGLTYWQMDRAPTGFIPQQDQGYLLVNVQLPDSASLERTSEVMTLLERICLGDDTGKYKGPPPPKGAKRFPGIPGIVHSINIAGQSFLMSANGSSYGSMFVILDEFHHRRTPETYDAAIAMEVQMQAAAEIDGAVIMAFRAPPIMGLGNADGFKVQVEQRGFVDPVELQRTTDELIAEGMKDPKFAGLFSMYRAESPQLYVDVDRTKCESLDVDINAVFNTLQVYMGGTYVNLFNKFGRSWQVNLLGEHRHRTDPKFLGQLKVRSKRGEMVPLGTLVEVRDSSGPAMVTRYNMYLSTSINGIPAPGVSSGETIKAINELADRMGVPFEWSEITFMQIRAGNVALFVFGLGTLLVYLVLAAKYESWKLPLSVILVVPMCLLCAVSGMLITGMPVDIFVQIGFLVLVGLAAKNAILIVEFAEQLRGEGKPLYEATVEACQLRLRPIVMTSFAFILGVLPLVLGEGAAAEMRRSLGTAVFSGMLGVTIFGIFLTPVFYYGLMYRAERIRLKALAATSTAATVSLKGHHGVPPAVSAVVDKKSH